MRNMIAIIEDDESIRELYVTKFELEGYAVISASNGSDGLQLIADNNPKVILLDLMMPIMGGVQMLTKLREQDWGGDARIIVLTNISKDEAPQSLRFLGVDGYIVKAHHTPAQIVTMVEDILKRST